MKVSVSREGRPVRTARIRRIIKSRLQDRSGERDGEEKSAQEHADQLRAHSFMMTRAHHEKVHGQVYFTGSGKFIKIGDEIVFEDDLRKRVKERSELVKPIP